MKKRIVFGLLMIVGVLAVLVADFLLERMIEGTPDKPPPVDVMTGRVLTGLPVAALVFLLLVAAIGEMARLAEAAGMKLLPVTGLVGAVMLGTLPYWWQIARDVRPHGQDVFPVFGFVVLLAFAEQMIRYRIEDAFRRIACTLLAVLYLGVGAACILTLRVDYGVGCFIAFLIAVKCTDMGAYFTGVAVGRHKLIPWLSPGKTWEGLLGGIIVAIAVTAAWVHFYPIPILIRGYYVQLWQAAIFGLLMALAGQFADLCESLLKRSAGLKDSGQVVPGFGGLLDILDSPLLAGPVALILLRAVFG
jgi:phosphatidate cytidylyltransferase